MFCIEIYTGVPHRNHGRCSTLKFGHHMLGWRSTTKFRPVFHTETPTGLLQMKFRLTQPLRRVYTTTWAGILPRNFAGVPHRNSGRTSTVEIPLNSASSAGYLLSDKLRILHQRRVRLDQLAFDPAVDGVLPVVTARQTAQGGQCSKPLRALSREKWKPMNPCKRVNSLL